MLRKKGFLNWTQLVDFSLVKAYDLFPAAEDEEPGCYQYECRIFSATYTLRHLFENSDAFHLFGPNGELFEIDSDLILHGQDTLIDLDSKSTITKESKMNGSLTADKVRENTNVIAPDYRFIDGLWGVVTTEACTKRMFGIWRKNKCESRCRCKYLSKFNGFTVLMSEIDVYAAWGIVAAGHAKLKQEMKGAPSEDINSLDFALNCFLDAFPNGKEGATWREIQEKTGYSRRTIVRALDKHGLK